MVVRALCALLGIGLVVLGLNGLDVPGARWLAVADLIAAVGAFAIASVPLRRRDPNAPSGPPLALGVGLFVLWLISFAAPAPVWMTWWTFAFASLFCLVSLAGTFDRRFERRMGTRRTGTYGVGFSPYFPMPYPLDFPWHDRAAFDRMPLRHAGKGARKGPKGYQRADSRIVEDISDRLWDQWDIDATDIEVQVSRGEVTLTGNVESRWAKRYVESLVDGVSGVHDVHNRLAVLRPGTKPMRAVS